MYNQPAIAIQKKWTVESDCLKTGIRYPGSINTTYLTDHQVTELISKVTAIGDPTSEQWVELRASAAESRISGIPVLAASLDALWGGNPNGHARVDILGLTVDDCLNRGALHDLGTHHDRHDDEAAMIVLSEKVLVSSEAAAVGARPEAVGKCLVARIAGSIRRKRYEPKPNFVDSDPDSEDFIDHLDSEMRIEAMAEYLEVLGDTSSRRVAHFFRSPRLWCMTSAEVAAEMGIEAANWRKCLSRAFRILRERFTF